MMNFRSFTRFWVIIAVTATLVGLILASWFFSLRVTGEEVLESYSRQQLALVEGAAVGIEAYFDDLYVGLAELLQIPEVQYFDESAARPILEAQLEAFSSRGISEIGFIDADGTARLFVTRPELERIDYSWRSYFKEARRQSPGQSAPVVELDISSADPAMLIAVPVHETLVNADHPSPSGQFRGVLVLTLSLNELVDRNLLPFKPPGDGQIFLVHDDLEIIWSSDDRRSGGSLLSNRDPAVLEMGERVANWATSTVQSGRYMYTFEDRLNAVELIAFAPIQLETELLAIGIRSPAAIVQQTSLANFQGQQTVLISSVLVLILGVMLGGIVLNIETRRRFKAEEALRKSERDQAILAERNRLAGDLHDSVTQSLYGIVLHADAAIANLSAGKQDAVERYLAEISSAGKEGLGEMRMMVYELRPPVLDQEGLEAALEMRLYAVERRVGIKSHLAWNLDGRLPGETEELLFRIAREALNNLVKHAHATKVTLTFDRVPRGVRMVIEDDGLGFDRAEMEASGGMGIRGMEERAANYGAAFEIDSRPGHGTRVVVEVRDE